MSSVVFEVKMGEEKIMNIAIELDLKLRVFPYVPLNPSLLIGVEYLLLGRYIT